MSFNYSPKIITNGLVLYLDAANVRSYPGTGTVWTDLSKSGNNGTLVNFQAQTPFSTVGGGSIVFDGTDNTVSIPSTLGGLTSLTILTWVYMTAYNPNGPAVFIWPISDNSAVSPFTIVSLGTTTSGVLNGTIGNGSTRTIFISEQSITLNRWYQVGLWWNGSIVKSTLNGVVSSTPTSAVYTLGNSSAKIYLGAYNTNNSYWLQGYLSNTLFYNRALSDSEVLQNYNTTRSRFGL